MVSGKRKITKEIYDRAQQNGGYITGGDMKKVFDVCELCGYGVYSPMAYQEGNEYMCRFEMGETCD